MLCQSLNNLASSNLYTVCFFSSRGNYRAINISQFSACRKEIVIKMSLI